MPRLYRKLFWVLKKEQIAVRVAQQAPSSSVTGAPQFEQNLSSLFKGVPQFSQKFAMNVSSFAKVKTQNNNNFVI